MGNHNFLVLNSSKNILSLIFVENDREGMWCDSVKVEYPSSLLPLPSGYNPGGSTEGPAGAAHKTSTSLIYTLVYLTSFICMFEIIL